MGHWGDLAADGKLGNYNGFGEYDGKGDRQRNDRSRSRRRSRTPPRKRSISRRRSPPRRGGGGGGGEEIMTLFVADLPDDARDTEISEDIDKSARVLRCMVTRKNGVCAFVRFGSVEDAERAMADLNDGTCMVGGKRCSAEMARRNTEVN